MNYYKCLQKVIHLEGGEGEAGAKVGKDIFRGNKIAVSYWFNEHLGKHSAAICIV